MNETKKEIALMSPFASQATPHGVSTPTLGTPVLHYSCFSYLVIYFLTDGQFCFVSPDLIRCYTLTEHIYQDSDLSS